MSYLARIVTAIVLISLTCITPTNAGNTPGFNRIYAPSDGGSKIQAGTVYTIKWTPNAANQKISIVLTRLNTIIGPTIADSIDNNVGSFNWTVPFVSDIDPGYSYSFKIQLTSDPTLYSYSNYFYIFYGQTTSTSARIAPSATTIYDTQFITGKTSSSSSSTSSSALTSQSSASASSTSTFTSTSPFPSSQTADPTPIADPSSGLSTGAKAGVGVGAAIGVLVLVSVVAFMYLRKRKRSAAKLGSEQPEETTNGTWYKSELHSETAPQEMSAGLIGGSGNNAVAELDGMQRSELDTRS